MPLTDLTICFKALDEKARAPIFATEGAACFDLASIESATIPLRGSATFRTGLAFDVPEDHVMLVFSRSGHGFKSGVRLSNCVGVIDSDYRGEVKVKLFNDESVAFRVEEGDRIAQAMILPVPRIQFKKVDELSTTARGENGFGSTGK